jgi:outer membrane protein assembly factor BamB
MRLERRPAVVMAAGLLALSGVALAADWPMWRCDTRRSATTPQELPGDLHLQWVRELPPLEPAWPDEPRMQFDATYEPIVAGKTMFVASPRSDSVTAFSTDSGGIQWSFYADGPVRFAPVVWDGKVYVASDDGHVYCLDASTGELLWRFQAAPTGRLLLGNKRLISAWPVRGAPVVVDGTVYFAAGIWPFMGIFIYALDADTGEIVWENDGSGSIYMAQPHNAPAFGGVAPQGYLVVVGDRLLVPGGRSAPACYDRKTGEFLYYHLAANNKWGNFHVSANRAHFFNDGYMYQVATGERLGQFGSIPVATDDAAYGAKGGAMLAQDVANPQFETYKDSKGDDQKRLVLTELWRLDGGVEKVWLRAGSRFFGHLGSRIMAIEPPAGDGGPSISWQTEVEGTPSAMVAADDRLFVVTLEGRVYCFGVTDAPVRQIRLAEASPEPGPWAGLAGDILAATKATDGYCLLWGLGDGMLADELARQSSLHVIAVDRDAGEVNEARERLDAELLYGTRVAVLPGDPLALQFPPHMASLIVVGEPMAAKLTSDADSVARLFDSLRPYGGVACLSSTTDLRDPLAATVRAAALPGAQVSRSGGFTLLTREGRLPGSGDWTHQYGGPANTCVSGDDLVKAPLGLLWFGGSSNASILPRHGHGPSEQVIGGRLFIEGPDSIRAMDVYTGRVLWERELAEVGEPYDNTSHQPGANAIGSNYVSAEDGVYVAYGERCLHLDPANGATVRELTLPEAPAPEGRPAWGYLAIWEDLLIAGAAPVVFEGEKRFGQPENWDATSSKRLVVMERPSGKVLWTREAAHGFRHNGIAVGAGKLFCLDAIPDGIVERMRRRGETVDETATIAALDARTGDVVWETADDVFGTWLGYSAEHDILLQAGRRSRDMLPDEPGDRMIAYRGADGTVLWDKANQYDGPCLLHGETIITQTISLSRLGKAFNLLTGEQLQYKNPITGAETPWQFGRDYGCNTVIASKHLMTFRSGAAGYFDLAGGGGTGNLGGFKSGCTSNLVVANGVLNAPDYTRTCICSYQNQTSLALIHMPEVEMWTFNTFGAGEEPVRRVGINLGAPGDRYASNGTLWLDWPSVGGPSPDIPVSIAPDDVQWFRRHSSRVEAGNLPWVAASGATGIASLTLTLDKAAQEERLYTVSLHFAEPEQIRPGKRVFTVALQGQDMATDLDVVAEAGGPLRAVVKQFAGIRVQGDLRVELRPSASSQVKAPVLCGVEVVEESG